MLRSLLLLVLCAAPVAAQPVPFSALEVSLGGALAAGEAPYTDYWDPGAGAEVRVETPFYLGRLALGGYVAAHGGRRDAAPDYLAVFPFAAWGYALELPGGVRLMPGLRTGLYTMAFDTDDDVWVRNEAELAAGPELRLSVPLARGWRLSAGAALVRIYTRERIDLRLVHVGLGRAFGTPRWLREALR